MKRALALVLLLTGSCTATPEVEPVTVDVPDYCEPLLEARCPLPWPSNRYTVADATTETGLRLAYQSEAFPQNVLETALDPTPWAHLDGFSPASQILVTFAEDLDPSNLPPITDYPASLAEDSPTLLLDMSTGERVPHFAEVDVARDVGEPQLLYLRPAARLKEATRYAVALRNLKHADGSAVEAAPAFVALRDDRPTEHATVEARRPAMEEVFTALTDAGIDRAGLLVAWDFTTASGGVIRDDLLFMRDDALSRVGVDGTSCTVTSTDETYGDLTRVVNGTFEVPWYLESGGSLNRLVRGADGKPAYQGMHSVTFVMAIPNTLDGTTPGRLLTYGHGLMGSDEEVRYGASRKIANDLKSVLVATPWTGMSEGDYATVVAGLVTPHNFAVTGERLHQGIINMLVLTRTIAGACKDLPEFQINGQRAFDPDERYYYGISQGGIFGGTYMALATDVTRGLLNVGAAFYPVMIERSVDFSEYEGIYINNNPLRMDRQLYMAMFQQLWDPTEPSGYLPFISGDPLPNTPAKKILYTVGYGDAQVPNLASDMAARSMGLPLLSPSSHPVWGLEEKTAPFDGSAYVVYDTGDPAPPLTNVPPDQDYGAHGEVRRDPNHMAQVDAFLRADGMVTNPCGGPCVSQ